MKVIALISQKGGSGKTTTAIHLAVSASLEGKQTVIIDLDPQASVATWSQIRGTDTPTVTNATEKHLSKILEVCRSGGIDTVIIDTPPHNNTTSLSTARISDLIIITTRPNILDLSAVSNTVELIKQTGKPYLVTLTATPPIGQLTNQAIEAIEAMGAPMTPHLSYRAAFQHAINAGKTVQEYEPTSKATDEIKALYQFITQKLGI